VAAEQEGALVTEEEIPRAIVNGRRVAITLLLISMAGTAVLAVLLIAWWMTQPVPF
jgi:hypothetical protein